MSDLEFMLAKEYSESMKTPKGFEKYAPLDWLMSEKLDGYRARFNPNTQSFVSRQNKLYNTPKWFSEFMPDIHIDGELFCGRDAFQNMGVVRKKNPIDSEWFNVKFYAYDLPEETGTFSQRYEKLKLIVSQYENIWKQIQENFEMFKNVSCPLVLTEHIKVKSMDHMKQFYNSVLKLKGEGIMLKDPESDYENKRSNYLLKYKPNFDAEAIIVGYKEGSGKYSGKLGSFVCQPLINNGDYQIKDVDKKHEFSMSGMDDSIRESYLSTHPVGTIITYEYSGFTNSRKPRFARYVRIRDDVNVVDKMDIENSKKNIDKCIEIFNCIASDEKSNGESFKSAAYIKAINAIKKMEDDTQLTAINLLQVKGVGQKIVDKVLTIIQTGTCPMYESIKNVKNPKQEFLKIHGVGPKKAGELVKNGFQCVEDLIKCENVKEYLNDTQIKALPYVEDLQKRIKYKTIQKHEKYLKQILKSIDPTAELTIAGSYRRKCKDSGDIDVLLKTPSVKNNIIYKKFIEKLVQEKYILETLSLGNKKFMGICNDDENIAKRIDIMYTKPEEYPFAILYFTGSKEFNTNMRSDLLSKGLSLNEYSLKDNSTKKPVDHVFQTEQDIFDYIKYDYVKPENR